MAFALRTSILKGINPPIAFRFSRTSFVLCSNADKRKHHVKKKESSREESKSRGDDLQHNFTSLARAFGQVSLFHTRTTLLKSKDASLGLGVLPRTYSQQPPLSHTLRLIDENGENLGVLSQEEARKIAEDRGLHIQIIKENDSSQEMICKLATQKDFIETKKRKRLFDKKISKQSSKVKEITMRGNIAEADLSRKITKAQELLSGDYKVKIFIRRRQDTSSSKLTTISNKIISELKEYGKVEGKLDIEGITARFSVIPIKAN